MSEIDTMMDRIEGDLCEDDIIVEIMKEYPDLYDLLNYTEFTVKERLEKNAFLYQQFRLLKIKEKHKLKRIEILRDEYIGKLYHTLRFENTISLGKIEAERYYIPKDENYIKFTKLHMRQQVRVETFEAIADAFDKQGYAMANFIKNLDL